MPCSTFRVRPPGWPLTPSPPSHLQVCRNLYRLFRFEEAPKLLRLPPEPPAANKSLLPPAPAASEHRSLVLPGSAAANANTLGLNPDTPGDQLYRFEALEIKELSHRLDGVLWPRQTTGCAETGSPEFPVVLLEVQMHPDSGFQHRLAAQTYRWFPEPPPFSRTVFRELLRGSRVLHW